MTSFLSGTGDRWDETLQVFGHEEGGGRLGTASL